MTYFVKWLEFCNKELTVQDIKMASHWVMRISEYREIPTLKQLTHPKSDVRCEGMVMGVRFKAFTPEEAEQEFDNWIELNGISEKSIVDIWAYPEPMAA